MLQAIAGRPPPLATVAAVHERMRADDVPWVGSYWIFLGFFAWIDVAMPYIVAGSDAARPLLDDAEAMLARLVRGGNAFHAIPYHEARIAALRGQDDVAIARLTAAVDAGWRRAWLLPYDPAFRRIRDDPRVVALVARVLADLATQLTHVG